MHNLRDAVYHFELTVNRSRVKKKEKELELFDLSQPFLLLWSGTIACPEPKKTFLSASTLYDIPVWASSWETRAVSPGFFLAEARHPGMCFE